MIGIYHYLVLSFIIFSIGATGVLLRRNIIIVLMSLELMFNSVNISLVAFSYFLQSMTGRVLVVFTITIAAAEVGIGLAILVALYRVKRSVNVDEANILKG